MIGSRAWKLRWAAGGIALLLSALTALVNYRFAQISPGGNDFMAHYTAWEAYLEHGINPYSDEAALYTQQRIYGRPAKPTEDQNRLTYPFFSIAIHGPFVLINSYTWARAFYMTLLQVALIAGVLLTVRTIGWRLPFGLLAVMLVWVLLDYPQARGIILGQFAIFGFLSVAAALYLLRRGHNGWAGVVLVLATVKPTLVFLVIPFFMIWAVWRRRWRFVMGFGAMLMTAMLISWLILPTWLTDWQNNVERYSDYTVGQSPVWLLTHAALPGLGQTGETIIAALLIGAMLIAWWLAFKLSGDDRLPWALGVTLVVSDLIVSRSATTNYALLLLPTFWLFAQIDRARRWGRAVVVGYMLLTVVGLWSLHAATVVGNQEQPIMFVPTPVMVGLALLVISIRSTSGSDRRPADDCQSS